MVTSLGCFSTILKQNDREQYGEQTHPWGSKLPLAKVKDQSQCWSFFIYKQGVNHKKTLIEGKPVNSEFCIQLLVGLLKQMLRVKPQFWEKDSWLLMHNAAAHSATIWKRFLVNHGMMEISHPTHTPDNQPFSIPSSQSTLKEKDFRRMLRASLPN
jgi:hypothetical protein